LSSAFSGPWRYSPNFLALGALEQRPAVRVIPLGRYPYLIFYTIAEDELIILHVRHGARKPVDPGSL
jgi:plasmid stabilization system protein ParE